MKQQKETAPAPDLWIAVVTLRETTSVGEAGEVVMVTAFSSREKGMRWAESWTTGFAIILHPSRLDPDLLPPPPRPSWEDSLVQYD